jgi:hypothetical protein
MPARTNQWPPKDYRRLYGSLPFGKLRVGISERSCELHHLPFCYTEAANKLAALIMNLFHAASYFFVS